MATETNTAVEMETPLAEVEVVSGNPAIEAEIPQNFWEAQGFLPEIAMICSGLEAEPEKFILTPAQRQKVDLIRNARFVEDLADYSTDQLRNIAYDIRNDIPRAERTIIQFSSQLSRARTVELSTVDYI